MNKKLLLLLGLLITVNTQARDTSQDQFLPQFGVFTDNMPSEYIKIIGHGLFQYLGDKQANGSYTLPINATIKINSTENHKVTVTPVSGVDLDCNSCAKSPNNCWCQINFKKPGDYTFKQTIPAKLATPDVILLHGKIRAGKPAQPAKTVTTLVTVKDSYSFNPYLNKIYRFDCTPTTRLKIKNANNSFDGLRLDCRDCDTSSDTCYCLVQFTEPGWYTVKQPLDDGSNGFLRRTIEVKPKK